MEKHLLQTPGALVDLRPPANRLAKASLVLSLIGWAIYLLQWCFDLTLGLALAALTGGSSALCATAFDVLPFLLWIAGAVSGHVSLTQVRHTHAAGQSRATWGLILSYTGLVFTFILVLLAVGLLATGIRAGWFTRILPSFLK